MIPSQLHALANHLWQSTLFAAAAGLLTLGLRRNRAQSRYWLWLAASVKFLVPFSILVDAGSRFGRHPAAAFAVSELPSALQQMSEPFVSPPPFGTVLAIQQSPVNLIPSILYAVWAIGFVTLICSWGLRWWRLRSMLPAASLLDLPVNIPVMTSPEFGEPGVFGVRRPVLLLPEGIADRLTPPQLEAIVRHEMCHVRRRDNLATAIHMSVEALFWFYPLVWWLGARLMEERERACDEEVLLMGSTPQVYAEGILKVCELYLESPLQCVAGATGSNLRQRIEAIMMDRVLLRVNGAKKLTLVIAGMIALIVPVVIGMMNAPVAKGFAAGRVAFDVASVKISHAPDGLVFFGPGMVDSTNGRYRVPSVGGNVTLNNWTLGACIVAAWDLGPGQMSGAAWLGSDRYDIIARTSPQTSQSDLRIMLQELLAERFKLTTHHEVKQTGIYALVLAKNGPRLKLSTGDQQLPVIFAPPGRLLGQGSTMQALALALSRQVGRKVVDKTGISGTFDFTLSYVSDNDMRPVEGSDVAGVDAIGPSIFTALQEQLGLRLNPQKGQVDVLVVDHAERIPTPN